MRVSADAPAPPRAPPLLALARLGSWAVADQAVQSIANFLAIVIFARAASAADFGVFSLALTGITFEMTLAGAALNQPLTVLAASRHGDEYRRYITSVLFAQLGFGALVAVPVLLAAMLAAARGWDHVGLLAAIVPAAVAMQIQDFIRQVLYVERRVRAAFVNDVLNYGGLCAGIAVLAVTGTLGPVNGLLVMGVASGSAVAAGLLQLRASFRWPVSRAHLIADHLATWRFGRWTLGVAALSVSSNYLTPFVLGAASGVAAAGALRAMVTIMGPLNVVYRTIGTALQPAAARAFERDGAAGLGALMRRASVVVMVPVVAYSLMVMLFARPLLSLAYGDRYAGIAWLMPAVALSFVLGVASSLLDAALRAQRITSTPFAVSAANFIFFWVVGVPVIHVFGLAGAGAVLVSVPVVALVLLVGRVVQELRTCQRQTPHVPGSI